MQKIKKTIKIWLVVLAILFAAQNMRAQTVQNFTAAATNEGISLYWDMFMAAFNYEIYWQTTPGVSLSSPNVIVTGNNIVSYRHTGLTVGQPYYYAIRACTNPGSPQWTILSNEISSIPVSQSHIAGGNADGYAVNTTCLVDLVGTNISQTVTGVTVASSHQQNVLFWDFLGGASYYTVEYDNGGGWTTAGTTVNLSYNHTGLTAGTSFSYRVTPFVGGSCPVTPSSTVVASPVVQTYIAGGNADGFAINTTCMITLTGVSVPYIVTGVTVASSVESNIIYWDYLAGATSYLIEYNTGGGWITAGTTANLSYNHTGLTAGVTYNYQVTPVIPGGCPTTPSAIASGTPAAQNNIAGGGIGDGFAVNTSCLLDMNGISQAPGPTNLAVASSHLQNVMYWSPMAGATSYTVRWSTDGTFATFTDVTGITNISWIHTGLTAGTTYYYKITAVTGGSCPAGFSNTASNIPVAQIYLTGANADGYAVNTSCLIDMNGVSIPITTFNLFVAASHETNVLYWDYVQGAASYLVEYNSGSGWQTAGTTINLSYNHTGLTAGTSYSYRVSPTVSGCPVLPTSPVVNIPVAQVYISGGNGDGYAVNTTCTNTLNGTLVALGVTGFTVAGSIESNVMYWDFLSEASSYLVEYNTGGGWITAATGANPTINLSYYHTGLTPGTTYNYQVTPVIPGGCPAVPSPTVSIAPSPQTPAKGGGNRDGWAMSTSCFTMPVNGIDPVITPASPVVVCMPATVDLNSTWAVSYQWLFNGAIIPGATNSTYTPLATGEYRVEIHNINNCIALSFATYVVSGLPDTADAITGTTSLCPGQTGVAYSIPPITYATGYVWSYSGTGATINGSGTNITIDFSSNATSGNLTVYGTNSCGNGIASPPLAITIAVNPVNVSIAAVPPGAICGGTNVVFTATPTNGGTTPAYQWLKNGSNISGETNDTYSSSSLINNDAVSCVLTSNASCVSNNPDTSNVITMTISPAPTIFNVTGGGPYCSGGTAVTVDLDSSEAGVNYQLLYSGTPLWSPVAGTGNPFSFGSQIQAGTYTVEATNAGGCKSTMNGNAAVSIYNCPAANVSVAINTTGAIADSSSIFDVSDIYGGVLLPRLSNSDRNSLISPDNGLIIYNTDSKKLNFCYGSNWYEVNSTSVSGGPGAVSINYGTSINTTGAVAANSAILDVSSTTKGVLIPRTLPGAIYGAAKGSIIYNIHTNKINFYNGSSWVELSRTFITNTTGAGSQTVDGCAVNLSNADPAVSAILDISAQNKAALFPRMTEAQRNNIAPATGLIIYNTTADALEYYDGGWLRMQ